jgi:hypothetical protein
MTVRIPIIRRQLLDFKDIISSPFHSDLYIETASRAGHGLPADMSDSNNNTQNERRRNK